jgi:hypothetical protein
MSNVNVLEAPLEDALMSPQRIDYKRGPLGSGVRAPGYTMAKCGGEDPFPGCYGHPREGL